MRTEVQISRALVKANIVAGVYDPSVPTSGLEAKTGEFPDAQGHLNFHAQQQQKRHSNKAEDNVLPHSHTQFLKLEFRLTPKTHTSKRTIVKSLMGSC